MQLLYLCNSTAPIHRSDLSKKKAEDVFSIKRDQPLVHIGAYCLMPNHFHLLLKDFTEEGTGISRFMQKVGIAYTMYFNMSRDRTGNLFVKPFRSRHVADDRYFKRVVQYIHFNPIEIYEPKWKEGKVLNLSELETKLKDYRFSSLPDYTWPSRRPEEGILDSDSVSLLQQDTLKLDRVINEMKEYYASLT